MSPPWLGRSSLTTLCAVVLSHIILGAAVFPPALTNCLLFAPLERKPHADRGLDKLGPHCLVEPGPAPGREQEPGKSFVEQKNNPMKPGLLP